MLEFKFNDCTLMLQAQVFPEPHQKQLKHLSQEDIYARSRHESPQVRERSPSSLGTVPKCRSLEDVKHFILTSKAKSVSPNPALVASGVYWVVA